MNPAPSFTHCATGRSAKAAAVLIAIWAGLFALWYWLDAAGWLLAVLFATTLPAALEFATGQQAWFELDETAMRWVSGRKSGEIALARIDHVRLETRLDFSVRVRVVSAGKRITLPQDCVPPPRALEAALRAKGIAVSRHHFGLG